MSKKKILLKSSPQPKRVRNYIIAGIFFLLYPLIFIRGDGNPGQSSDAFMSSLWPTLAFLTMALILFALAAIYKRRDEMYFVKFFDHGLTFRNKGAKQKAILKTDLLKVEIGDFSATFYQINGEKQMLNFEEAGEEDKYTIKAALQDYAAINN